MLSSPTQPTSRTSSSNEFKLAQDSILSQQKALNTYIEIIKNMHFTDKHTEEVTLKEAVRCKLICAATLKLYLIENILQPTLTKANLLLPTNRLIDMASYIPNHVMMGAFFLESLQTQYQTFKQTKINYEKELHSLQLNHHEKETLIKALKSARAAVLAYSTGFFDLEENIKYICGIVRYTWQDYLKLQKEVLADLIEQTEARADFINESNHWAIQARREHAIIKTMIEDDNFKWQYPEIAATALSIRLSKPSQESHKLFPPSKPEIKTPGDKKGENNSAIALSSNKVVVKKDKPNEAAIVRQYFDLITQQKSSDLTKLITAINHLVDIYHNKYYNHGGSGEMNFFQGLEKRFAELNDMYTEFISEEVDVIKKYNAQKKLFYKDKHLDILRDIKYVESEFNILKKSIEDRIKESEAYFPETFPIRDNEVDCTNFYIFMDFEVDNKLDSASQAIAIKLQINAMLFEIFQWMERRVPLNSPFRDELNPQVAVLIRNAILHCNGFLAEETLNLNNLKKLATEVADCLAKLPLRSDRLYTDPFYKKALAHSNKLQEQKEEVTVINKIKHAFTITIKNLLFSNYQHPLPRNMRDYALKMINRRAQIYGLYAPGVDAQHKVQDRYVASAVRLSKH